MININIELFKRYGIKKKYDIVEHLTEDELLLTNLGTIERCVKEQGTGFDSKKVRSHNKYLSIRSSRQEGNNWNSNVDEIRLYNKVLYISFYLQYNNTDTTDSDKLSNFLIGGEYIGRHEYTGRYDDIQTAIYRYDVHAKARVIKSILLEYLDRKSEV